MELATRMMSGEKYVFASTVIIIANGLQDVYAQMLQKFCFRTKLRKWLQICIKELLHSNLESSPTLLISTFLDPRFKNVGFSTKLVAERAKTLITNVLTNFIESSSSVELEHYQMYLLIASSEQNEEFSIWGSFDKKKPRLLNWWKNSCYYYRNLCKFCAKFDTVTTSV
jgi:hypothetical protein